MTTPPIMPVFADPRTPQPPSRFHAGVRGVVAGMALAAAVICQVAAARMPQTSFLDGLTSFLFSLSAVVVAVVLVIAAVAAATRPGIPVMPQRPGPAAVIGLAFSSIAAIAWLAMSLPSVIGSVVGGADASMADLLAPLVVFGPLWVLGLVFGVLSLRGARDRRLLLAAASTALGLLLLLPATWGALALGV